MCIEGFRNLLNGTGALTAESILARIRATASRQSPRCAVLTCSDSRLSPELLTLSNIGDMFVIRIAGNVVTDAVYDSLKFAVERLGVRKIYVIGHKRCGAVELALKGEAPPSLAAQLNEAVKRAGGDLRKAEVENVKIACEKLGELGAEVEGYYYDLDGPALIPVCKSP